MTKRVGAVLCQSKKTPRDVQEGDRPVHGEVGEEKHEGDLADHGADGVERLELDELVAVEGEVFFEAGYVGVVFWGGRVGVSWWEGKGGGGSRKGKEG